MITRLRLQGFKNFQDATLVLGPLTLLVGTNASGKSNLRDAFRFLQGIGRGYTLAEIIGEKYGEGGVLQWRGIRGGTREITFQGTSTFALEVVFMLDNMEHEITYRIEVDPGDLAKPPHVVAERLAIENDADFLFESTPVQMKSDPMYLSMRVKRMARNGNTSFQQDGRIGAAGAALRQEVNEYRHATFLNQQPALSQVVDPERGRSTVQPVVRRVARACMDELSNMRFLDLSPDAMRQPSFPGQTVLNDRGENFSSVFQSLCKDRQRKQALLQWVYELTPMDAIDFDFPADQIGRVLVTLIEANGQRTSAYSASDGTLRFLGMLTALLGSEPGQFYFIDEMESNIHPTRLYLLLQLIEQQVARGGVQMVATTHSPQLLNVISPATLESAAIIYRRQHQADAQIKRLLDLPDAKRLIEEQELSNLHAFGWLEDAAEFLESQGTAA